MSGLYRETLVPSFSLYYISIQINFFLIQKIVNVAEKERKRWKKKVRQHLPNEIDVCVYAYGKVK
jgi:hypothetical protein